MKTCKKGIHQYPDAEKRCPECKKVNHAAYNKAWVDANPEKIKAYLRAYRAANPEKFRLKEAKRYAKNPEKERARNAEWYKKNLGKANALTMKRVARKFQATPAWADLAAIKDIYVEAQRQKLTVDHIVPLQGETVCGLHVHYNLQLITGSENSRKGNRHWPDMP